MRKSSYFLPVLAAITYSEYVMSSSIKWHTVHGRQMSQFAGMHVDLCVEVVRTGVVTPGLSRHLSPTYHIRCRQKIQNKLCYCIQHRLCFYVIKNYKSLPKLLIYRKIDPWIHVFHTCLIGILNIYWTLSSGLIVNACIFW